MAHAGGRPLEYTEDIANEICLRISEGESLRSVCESDDMPAKSTVLRWVFTPTELKAEKFRDQYDLARQMQAELMADEINEISDSGQNDFLEREEAKTGETYYATNNEAVARSKLRLDARKWTASRLLSKYRDKAETKVTIDAAGDFLKAIQPTTGLPSDRDK